MRAASTDLIRREDAAPIGAGVVGANCRRTVRGSRQSYRQKQPDGESRDEEMFAHVVCPPCGLGFTSIMSLLMARVTIPQTNPSMQQRQGACEERDALKVIPLLLCCRYSRLLTAAV